MADFADAVLEDYVGDGFTSESEIRETLDSMEDHWEWMSQGTEVVEWDLVRITLPENLTEDAYPSWPVFREAVVDLASESVDFGDYDSDSNGVVDGMFIIASSAEVDCPFLVGGTARAGDACTFVDGQASLSVRVRAVGNFNHELGHCRGLPDAYGTYATLFYLTLMHGSWPVPPNGFSAFDRMKLGWTEPTLVSQTTTGITLPPAEESLAALRIATARSDEYFLIEYRKRSDGGYGSSADIAYDGLAVYHVFEPSRQAVDPPRIRLVPADALIAAGAPPEADDFLFPENAAMPDPFEVRGYFSPDPVFGITNVARSEEGMSFDVIVPPTPAETPSVNLLVNGSFEDGSGPEPDGWSTAAWHAESATFSWEPELAWEGSRSVGITVPPEATNDARWTREVTGLSADSGYLLCGWLKGEGIEVPGSRRVGANLTVMSPSAHSPNSGLGTFDWTEHCVAFMAQETTATVGCRLGYFGSTASGDMWCDGLELLTRQATTAKRPLWIGTRCSAARATGKAEAQTVVALVTFGDLPARSSIAVGEDNDVERASHVFWPQARDLGLFARA